MSIDLEEPKVGIESARDALEEFRATQDELGEFFGDVFDQLQSLSLELFARHKTLEAGEAQKSEAEQTLVGCREELLRCIAEMQQVQGQQQADREETRHNWQDIRAGHERFLEDHADLREVRESLKLMAGELSGVKADVARERKEMHDVCANVDGQLEKLSALAAELNEAQSRPGGEAQIAGILEHTKEQQAQWLKEREKLESDLENMHRHAAEQEEILNEQKRLAGQQRAELSGELKRMKNLLQNLAGQVRGETAGSGHDAKPAVDSGVLGSVLAQFEMLQRDVSVARSGGNREAEPSSNGKH